MITDRPDTVVAKWQSPREHVALATSIREWLDRLHDLGPEFHDWFVPTGTSKASRRQHVETEPSLERIVREATSGPALPRNEDVFIFALWNGQMDERSAALRVRDRLHVPGSYDPPGVADLGMPRASTIEQVVEATRVTMEVFGPDIGGVTSSSRRSRLDDGNVAGPIMYFGEAGFEIDQLPAGFIEEPIATPGRLVRARSWKPGTGYEAIEHDLRNLQSVVRRRIDPAGSAVLLAAKEESILWHVLTDVQNAVTSSSRGSALTIAMKAVDELLTRGLIELWETKPDYSLIRVIPHEMARTVTKDPRSWAVPNTESDHLIVRTTAAVDEV